MNVRLTILLAVLAVMIGSTWAIIEFTDLVFRSESDPDKPWLYHIEESEITHIEVVYNDEAIEFGRDPASNRWRILGDPDYPVFNDRWAGTPLLLSGPRVNRGLKQTIDDPAQYGLDPPESIVRVSDYASNTIEFHMGIPTPDGRNQYVRLVGDDALYTVPAIWSDVVNRLVYDPPWGKLFDQDIGQITVVEVNADDKTAVYYLSATQWLVHPDSPPVDPDQSRSAPVSEEWPEWLELLAAPRVDAIEDDRLQDRETERLEEYGLSPPDVRIVMARRGQATLEFHLAEGPPGSDSYYARIVDNVDETLYSIRKPRLEGIEGLATDPLIDPDWEPPAQNGESEAEPSGS